MKAEGLDHKDDGAGSLSTKGGRIVLTACQEVKILLQAS